MTSHPNSPRSRLTERERSRRSLEEVMAKHQSRQKWLGPLIWLETLVVSVGVLTGIFFLVFLEDRSIAAPGDQDLLLPVIYACIAMGGLLTGLSLMVCVHGDREGRRFRGGRLFVRRSS